MKSRNSRNRSAQARDSLGRVRSSPENSSKTAKTRKSPVAGSARKLKATVDPQKLKQMVREMYRTLSRAWGRQHWWPAETPFEVIAGAILTQNTSWINVEKAMASLRAAGVLSVEGVRDVQLEKLQQLIRSSGYFRQKAQRLKNFVAFLDARYEGSMERMFAAPTSQLRAELLTQNGIGAETADSILLYAGHHETFVVDAYTRRIFERHQLVTAAAKYDELRNLVEEALRDEQSKELGREVAEGRGADSAEGSPDGASADELHSRDRIPPAHPPSAMSLAERSPLAQVYNEMHGLLVQVGKHYCLKQEAKCESCPLAPLLPEKGWKPGLSGM